MLNGPLLHRDLPVSTVIADHSAAYEQAMHRLADLGHRRIVLMQYPAIEQQQYRELFESLEINDDFRRARAGGG